MFVFNLIFDFIFHFQKYFQLLFRFADKILMGDDVLVNGNDELSPEKVTNVTGFTMQGK